jgi:hypothetical protein
MVRSNAGELFCWGPEAAEAPPHEMPRGSWTDSGWSGLGLLTCSGSGVAYSTHLVSYIYILFICL